MPRHIHEQSRRTSGGAPRVQPLAAAGRPFGRAGVPAPAIVQALQASIGNRRVTQVLSGLGRAPLANTVAPASWIARQPAEPWRSLGVRSPAVEELVTQVSVAEATAHGRPLSREERRLAQSVFGRAIHYDRVRLIPTPLLEYRTVGDTIRIPTDFSISHRTEGEYMAQTLIHELTHVWQYQHGGTSYISTSLASQVAGAVATGSRNAAYDYDVAAHTSFFEFTPEQQGRLIKNYFAMKRDAAAPPHGSYTGNHLGPDGNWRTTSYADRAAEINRELPSTRC
jgi:hypothetical protein